LTSHLDIATNRFFFSSYRLVPIKPPPPPPLIGRGAFLSFFPHLNSHLTPPPLLPALVRPFFVPVGPGRLDFFPPFHAISPSARGGAFPPCSSFFFVATSPEFAAPRPRVFPTTTPTGSSFFASCVVSLSSGLCFALGLHVIFRCFGAFLSLVNYFPRFCCFLIFSLLPRPSPNSRQIFPGEISPPVLIEAGLRLYGSAFFSRVQFRGYGLAPRSWLPCKEYLCRFRPPFSFMMLSEYWGFFVSRCNVVHSQARGHLRCISTSKAGAQCSFFFSLFFLLAPGLFLPSYPDFSTSSPASSAGASTRQEFFHLSVVPFAFLPFSRRVVLSFSPQSPHTSQSILPLVFRKGRFPSCWPVCDFSYDKCLA